MAKIEDRVTELALNFVEEKGLELVDVEFAKEGSDWFLRVFIDKPEGITLDDCEMISRILDEKLDEVDYIPQAYHLEVSSPGIERPLKNTKAFQRFIGQTIQVTTYIPIDNKKKHVGQLIAASDAEITLNAKDNQLIIPRDKVTKANLVWIDDKKK